MDAAYGLTPLIAAKLVVYTFSTLIHLFLMVLILGNRELKNVLESAMVMSRGDTLMPEDFAMGFRGGGKRDAAPDDMNFLRLSDYREARRQFEIAYVRGKLREHGGNITRTAAAIGLHRQSLQEKLRELGIRAEQE